MVSQGEYWNPLVAAYLFPRGENFNAIKTFERLDPSRNIPVQYWPVSDGTFGNQKPYWIAYRKVAPDDKDRYMFNMDGTLETHDDLVLFVKELNKYIGPKSDPEGKGHKLVCIDGRFHEFIDELDEYVDYWIGQNYYGLPSLDNLECDPSKFIMTENFELKAPHGGNLLRMAEAMPSVGFKGGFGAYRFDGDYGNTPNYKWMRQAIQINQRVFNEWKAKQGKASE